MKLETTFIHQILKSHQIVLNPKDFNAFFFFLHKIKFQFFENRKSARTPLIT